jgi:hypothetical protein
LAATTRDMDHGAVPAQPPADFDNRLARDRRAVQVLRFAPIMWISTVPISIAGWGVCGTAPILAIGYAGLSANDALAA